MTKVPNAIIPDDPMRGIQPPPAEGWEAVADLVAYVDAQGWWDPVLAAKLAAVRAALKTKAN